MTKVKFYPTTEVDDALYKYAVIMAKYSNEWVFVRHKDRATWESPGGHREINEPIFTTAERELIEETGASVFKLEPVCAYSVTAENDESFGHLFYADIQAFSDALEFEIAEVRTFSALPDLLTYPFILPHLYERINTFLDNK